MQPITSYRNEVLQIVKKAGTSFYLGMRFLPKAKREAMFSVYAFCRRIDDIADEPDTLENKEKGLNDWQNIIEALYTETSVIPDNINVMDFAIAQCLKEDIASLNLPKQEFIELIEGMRMDMNAKDNTPLSEEELSLYCRRVAGAVGVLSVHIFGSSSKEAIDFALALGEALQITNILRDIKEDALMKRIYIPLPLLQKYELIGMTASEAVSSPNIGKVREELSNRADKLYDKADNILSLMNKNEYKIMRPAIMMRNMYYIWLLAIKKQGFDIVEPPKINKLMAMSKVILGNKPIKEKP